MKSTLVKIFLVLNLLLAIGAAAFGYVVFRDRELVKARTVMLEEHIADVSQSLTYGEQQPWEEEAAGDGPFALSAPRTQDDLQAYVANLDALEAASATRVEQLTERHATLLETQAELAQTQAELAERERDRDATRGRVATLEGTLSTTEGTLRDTRTELSTLERTNQSLARQLEDLNRQVDTLQTTISTTQEQLQLRTGERDRVEELLAACRQPVNRDGSVSDWHEKTAQILAVEPEWNYVVINRGEVDVLPMFLEAFVHRGDTFVGKIRVMQVEDTVALAEILNDTMTPGMSVKAGDTIFF